MELKLTETQRRIIAAALGSYRLDLSRDYLPEHAQSRCSEMDDCERLLVLLGARVAKLERPM